jgi:hypothetical protein
MNAAVAYSIRRNKLPNKVESLVSIEEKERVGAEESIALPERAEIRESIGFDERAAMRESVD